MYWKVVASGMSVMLADEEFELTKPKSMVLSKAKPKERGVEATDSDHAKVHSLDKRVGCCPHVCFPRKRDRRAIDASQGCSWNVPEQAGICSGADAAFRGQEAASAKTPSFP